MNNSFKVATIGGIQILVDWTWLLAFAFFTWSLGAYYDTTFHSWGHGTAYLIGAISTILLFDHLLDGSHRAVAVQGPDETLLGLVTVTDLRHLQQENWMTTPVSRIMTPAAKLRTVTPTEDLRQAIALLADNRYHQLPVVEHDRLVGLLNRDHVMRYLQLRQLQSRQPAPASSVDDQSMTPPSQHQVG